MVPGRHEAETPYCTPPLAHYYMNLRPSLLRVRPEGFREHPTTHAPRQGVTKTSFLASQTRSIPSVQIVPPSAPLYRPAFIAPHDGSLWQSDLNQVIQHLGIIYSSIVDVSTGTWEALDVLDTKLAAAVFMESNLPAILRRGRFPDLWTTDKGSETGILAFAANLAKRLFTGDASKIGHRFIQSRRQSIIESRNNQINVRMNLYVILLAEYMEEQGLYNNSDPVQKGALQALLVPVIQYRCDLLVSDWDVHTIRHHNQYVKGKPRDLRQTRPHPGGATPVPQGVDFVGLFERLRGRAVRREPEWRAARDPLHGQRLRQTARWAAVMALWGGSVRTVWADIVNNCGRNLFIPGYLLYLAFR
jgi:hypothetical protein